MVRGHPAGGTIKLSKKGVFYACRSRALKSSRSGRDPGVYHIHKDFIPHHTAYTPARKLLLSARKNRYGIIHGGSSNKPEFEHWDYSSGTPHHINPVADEDIADYTIHKKMARAHLTKKREKAGQSVSGDVMWDYPMHTKRSAAAAKRYREKLASLQKSVLRPLPKTPKTPKSKKRPLPKTPKSLLRLLPPTPTTAMPGEWIAPKMGSSVVSPSGAPMKKRKIQGRAPAAPRISVRKRQPIKKFKLLEE